MRPRSEEETGDRLGLGDAAKRAAVTTLVVVSIVALALALWKIKLIVALVFLGFTIAAAMRPGVERLAAWHVPRGFAVLLHYAALFGAIAAFLAFVAPPAVTQITHAVSRSTTTNAAKQSTGLQHKILVEVQTRLKKLPSASHLIHPAISATRKAVEVVIGLFFTFAVAAYWIYERDQTIDLVAKLLPRPKRRKLRETWKLIDLKLGAFVRGQLLMIMLVASLLSLAFWLDGMPYWLLLGIFAGVFELVPFIGPLIVGIVTIGAGLTVSWQVAVGAAIAVIGLRLLQDYVISPKILGGAVGMSPLLVIFSVTAIGILLGGFYVLIAIPITSSLVTLVQVLVFGLDPETADVPSVIFPSSDSEA